MNHPLILASNSPRRKLLLNQLGLKFTVMAANIDEELHPQLKPEEYVRSLAFYKAKEIASQIYYQAIVVGADTIVVLDEVILNKPSDSADAERMLRLLSGRTHIVYTGLAFIDSSDFRCEVCHQMTKVRFRVLDENEIRLYVSSGSPLDKAGAYGIQDDFGAVFVEHIEGCYYNIVGLPLEMFYSALKKFISLTNK